MGLYIGLRILEFKRNLLPQFIKKNPTKCNNVPKFYYSIFIWSSTCFGRHTAHHQEPKIALAASGFSYVEGCWMCSWWTVSGTVYCFRFLMMGGVLPETCWASYKYGIIKFWYIAASCWIFLYELYNDARIQEHQVAPSVFRVDESWSWKQQISLKCRLICTRF
jgi:hypothetical protein